MPSSYEIQLYDLLRHCIPGHSIRREVKIPGGARLDFFIPSLKVAFEFDGEQHYKYVPHFHKNRSEFHHAQERDFQKEQYCKHQGILLVRLTKKQLNPNFLDQWFRLNQPLLKVFHIDKPQLSPAEKQRKLQQREQRRKRYQELKKRFANRKKKI